jgi:pyruvate/2-oxoglutarate dehydrogenase complex dihydrolipoamide acyltransferase (E2) component
VARTEVTLNEDEIGGDGEAEVTGWFVDDGAAVAQHDPITELSTSKAMIEVPAPVAGRVVRLVALGDTVLPDQPFAAIEH